MADDILTDYQGRSVRLTSERIEHILEHPEMSGMRVEIVRTVGEPDVVVRSRSDAEVSLLHRLENTEDFGEKWLCVVIKYLEQDAFVLTVYLTDKVKSGVVIWRRK
jgi:hypothetical protein